MTISLTSPAPTKPGYYFCMRPGDYEPQYVIVQKTIRDGLLLITPGISIPFRRLTGKEKWSEKIEFAKEKS